MLVSLAVTALLASCPADAAKTARERYQAVDYPAVLAAVKGVEDCTDGTAEELAEAVRWRGQALAATRQTADAVEAFALAITIYPLYVLDPMVAPKVHTLFNQGRAKVTNEKRVFGRVVARNGTEVTLEVFDPRRKVRSVELSWAGGRVNAAWRGDVTWIASGVPLSTELVTFGIEQSDAEPTLLRHRPVPAAPAQAVVLTPAPVAAAGPAPAVVAAQQQASSSSSSSKLPLIIGVSAGAAVVIAVAVGIGVAAGNAKLNGSLGRLDIPPMAEQ